MTFESVEKPVGTLDLLLYLFRRGKASVTEAISDLGLSPGTFYAAKDRLESLGLAYEEEQVGHPRYVYLGLTREGDAAAAALAPFAERLSTILSALEAELVRLEAQPGPETVPRRLELLSLLAAREFDRGRWADAERSARRLIELSNEHGAPHGMAQGRLVLGRILQKQDRHDESMTELAQALRLAEVPGRHAVACEADYLLGASLERQGLWAEVMERFASTSTRAAKAGDLVWEARAKEARARILARRGEPEESLRLLREVVATYEQAGARDELARAYASLGSTLYTLDLPEASDWFEKSIEAARRAGDPRIEAYGLTNASAQWIDAGRLGRAESYLRRARLTFEELGEPTGLAAAEENTANLLVAQGRTGEAEAHFDIALRLARQTRNRRFREASANFNRGRMLKGRGRSADATAALSEAKRIFAELGNAPRVARCERELRELTRS